MTNGAHQSRMGDRSLTSQDCDSLLIAVKRLELSMKPGENITVENIDHLGLVAGIIDEIGLVEQINELLGLPHQEKVSAGHVVKAMISRSARKNQTMSLRAKRSGAKQSQRFSMTLHFVT